MDRSLVVTLASLACTAAAAAHAQVPTAYGPDNGFFRPSPDVSLTAPKGANGSTAQAAQQPFLTITSPQAAAVPATVSVVPPAVYNRGMAASGAPQVAPPIASAATTAVAAVPMPSPGSAATSAAPAGQVPAATPPQAWTERQMDRSENEADRARAQMQSTPPGVGAAFDGTTSAENR